MSASGGSFLNLFARLGIQERAFRVLENSIMSNIRVAAPGIVQSFNVTKQTAVVQLAIREIALQDNIPTDVTIAVLVDVPIAIPQCLNYAITFPIQAGTECLVIFSDRDPDGWWQNGGVQNQIGPYIHHLSNAFAIIGIKSQPNVISNYSATTLQIRDNAGDTIIEIVAATQVVNITCKTANVNASVQANVTSPDIELDGAVTVNGNLMVNGNLSVSGSHTASFGGAVTFSSTLGVTGLTTLTGGATISGRAFLAHTHSGVTTGSGNSGGVN